MKFIPVKTALLKEKENILEFLVKSLKKIKITENSIIIVSGKVVSVSENGYETNEKGYEKSFIKKHCDQILTEKNGMFLTIKDNIVIPNAGMDLSNAPKGKCILWPEKPWKTAESICLGLKKHFKIKNLGLIISDSRITPMRKGTTGIALAWHGFEGLSDERGKKDLFGKKLIKTQIAMADNLVSASIILTGEANEQTPIVVVKDAPMKFTSKKANPKSPTISQKEDLFDL